METKAFSEFTANDSLYNKVREAVLYQINNPDKDSEFEKRNQAIAHLTDDKKIELLLKAGYDMMLGYEEDRIIGLFAYEKKQDGWHMFRVKKETNGENIVWPLLKSYLDYVREKCPQKRTRLGKGGDERVVRMIDILYKKQDELEIKVDKESHWIELL